MKTIAGLIGAMGLIASLSGCQSIVDPGACDQLADEQSINSARAVIAKDVNAKLGVGKFALLDSYNHSLYKRCGEKVWVTFVPRENVTGSIKMMVVDLAIGEVVWGGY